MLVLWPLAISGKPVGDRERKPLGPLQKYAKLTSKVAGIHLKMTIVLLDGGVKRSAGDAELWGDKKSGRYAFEVNITRTRGDRVSVRSEGCIRTNGETVKWRRRDGRLTSARKRKQAKDAKLPAYVDDLDPLCFIYDGLYGYKMLAREITLKPDKPPQHEKDGLRWYLVEAVKHKERTAFQKAMRLDRVSLWLGFSPEDGWIHGLVFKEKSDNDLGVLKITKLDLKPDLKGAFDLPADVKALLDEREEKDRAQSRSGGMSEQGLRRAEDKDERMARCEEGGKAFLQPWHHRVHRAVGERRATSRRFAAARAPRVRRAERGSATERIF